MQRMYNKLNKKKKDAVESDMEIKYESNIYI